MAGGICSVNVSKLLSTSAVLQSWSAVQWYAFAGFQNAVSNTYQYTDFLAHTRLRMPLWRLRWRRWKWNTSKVKRYWSLISSRYMFSDAYVLSLCDVLAWFSTDLTKTGLIPRPSPPPAFDRLQAVYPLSTRCHTCDQISLAFPLHICITKTGGDEGLGAKQGYTQAI